ncbi:hypothetical protein C8Q75DRAFT_801008 [Abortiporus biennis]|nr:hypothetical protein C8Q75DRAFT_801008 [Abortiporus biennis]
MSSILSRNLEFLGQLSFIFHTGLPPTIKTILHRPSMILHPRQIRAEFMLHVWKPFADGMDKWDMDIKKELITSNAKGVVLDIGAGLGHTIKYLDTNLVTKYIALEPNILMHSAIRGEAHKAGFREDEGTLIILPYGAEEIDSIVSTIVPAGCIVEIAGVIDTFISVNSLCSVPSPQQTIRSLIMDPNLLKPAGHFLFYEHILNPLPSIAFWQKFWTPVWRNLLGGCCMDRQTDDWILSCKDEVSGRDVWAQKDVKGIEGEDPEHWFCRVIGKCVKGA